MRNKTRTFCFSDGWELVWSLVLRFGDATMIALLARWFFECDDGVVGGFCWFHALENCRGFTRVRKYRQLCQFQEKPVAWYNSLLYLPKLVFIFLLKMVRYDVVTNVICDNYSSNLYEIVVRNYWRWYMYCRLIRWVHSWITRDSLTARFCPADWSPLSSVFSMNDLILLFCLS